jgi:hypothetical protein
MASACFVALANGMEHSLGPFSFPSGSDPLATSKGFI